MHYTLLTAVSIPQSLEDKEGDQRIIGIKSVPPCDVLVGTDYHI